MEKVPQEAKELIFKIFVPALVTLFVKLAVASKHKKVTWISAFLSFVIALGIAYLCSSWVLSNFEDTVLPIACITLLGEKVAVYLMYRLNVDEIADTFIKAFIERYNNKDN